MERVNNPGYKDLIPPPVDVTSVVFNFDYTQIASGGNDNLVRVWDAKTGTGLRTLGGHTKRVWSVAFHPTNNNIVSGSKDGTIKIWDVDESITTLVFSPPPSMDKVKNDVMEVLSVAFNNDGTKIVSGSKDGTVKIWSLNTTEPIVWKDTPTLLIDSSIEGKAHAERVNSVRFSPHGKLIASGSLDGTVKLWKDGESNVLLATVIGYFGDIPYGVWSVAFSPDGNFLASGSGGREASEAKYGKEAKVMIKACVKIWELTKLLSQSTEGVAPPTPQPIEPTKTYELSPNQSVHSVAFSPDSKMIAAGLHDFSVLVYDITTDGHVTLTGHSSYVNSVAFGDNSTLVSGGNDGSVKIWDLTKSGGGSNKTKRKITRKLKRKTKKILT